MCGGLRFPHMPMRSVVSVSQSFLVSFVFFIFEFGEDMLKSPHNGNNGFYSLGPISSTDSPMFKCFRQIVKIV